MGRAELPAQRFFEPSWVLCVGFDHSQFREFAHIVKSHTGLVCILRNIRAYNAYGGAHNHIIVAHCENGTADAGRTRKCIPDLGTSDVPKLAVVAGDADQARKSEIFRMGYIDYLSYPFISEEVAHRLFSSVRIQKAGSSLPKFSDDRLVDQTCRYLASDISYNRGVEALARVMGTNRNKLSRLFRSALGVGPIGWLRHERMKRAANLLEETEMSVLEIAFWVGYEDANNFSTAFRRTYGRTPREQRHQCKNQRK